MKVQAQESSESKKFGVRSSEFSLRRFFFMLTTDYWQLTTFFHFCLLPFAFCLLPCFFLPSPAFAGHGFSSTFGNIEWLPEPGRTPDSALYRLDAVREAGQLLLARTNEAKVQLCLTFAREKLAELEAMVKAEKADAAKTATVRYTLYVDRAWQLTTESATEKESLADLMANAFLEHQYMLSVIYEELPASTRAILFEVIAAAREKYQGVTKLLSPKKKGALFFKEEEVRWSVEMAKRLEEERP